VKYKSVPIGRISRERLARHIVHLIEEPRRALFISRIYEVPVLINKLFPEVVDWVSSNWVRRKQKQEKRSLPEDPAPVQYARSTPLWQIASGFLALALIARLWRRKR
jgi:hypothetical protein